MQSGKATQIIIAAIVSVIAGLGLGPLVAYGVAELLDAGTPSVATTNISVLSFTIAIFLLGRAVQTGKVGPSLAWLRHPQMRLLTLGSIALAGAALFVANIDSANTSAWRGAARVTVDTGSSVSRLREFGRQFARISVAESSDITTRIGEIAVGWNIWTAGGRADLLVRKNASATAAEDPCADREVLNIVAIGSGQTYSSTELQPKNVCGQWQLLQVELPRGATALQFNLNRYNTTGDASVDIMLAAVRPNLSFFWTAATVIAVGLVLTIVGLLSLNLRATDGSSSARAAVATKSGSGRNLCTIAAVILFGLVSNSFFHWYVSQEKTIYTWDYSGYWMSSRNVSDFLRGAERKTITQQKEMARQQDVQLDSREPGTTMPDPGAIAALLRSIRFAEYNVSSNIPVAAVMAVFGGSRMVYELSLLNIYALSAVFMLIVAVRACGRDAARQWPSWWPFLPVIVVICCVPFWVPVLRGYMGISVAAINLAVFWLYFREPVREIRTGSLALIGLLLLLGVILQRWNAYWVVGFFVMAAADGIWQLISGRRFNFLAFLRAMRAPIVSGFTAFFLFAVVAWPKIVRTVTTDYADLYSAFQEDDSLLDALLRQVDAFGMGIFTLLILSFLYLVVKSATSRVAVLLGLQIACGFFLFTSTQTMGPHQYFILLPGLLILLALALASALASANKPTVVLGAGATALVLAFGIASGKAVFVPAAEVDGVPARHALLSQSYRPPLVSNDVQEFARLARHIDVVMQDAPAELGIYVLSGSEILNANHLKTLTASTGAPFNSVDRVLPSAVVDKRDGFPREIFEAHIVISSDPVQLNRRPADHQVIRVPAAQLFDGTGIGAAFERLPDRFQLDGGVDAVLFRRTRPNTTREIALLSAALKAFYPDRPYVYQ